MLSERREEGMQMEFRYVSCSALDENSPLALEHLGLLVADLESRRCSQQLLLSESFICPVDYPRPESRH